MTTGAPATIYGDFRESAERGQQEAQRIQQMIDNAGGIIYYISGPIPTTKINNMKEGLQYGIFDRGHFEEQG